MIHAPTIVVAALAMAAGAPATTLDTLVRTERSFSALSVEKGMRTAFLEYLAEDGLIFRPRPINGKQLWSGRTNPEETLIWEPSYAEVSGAGDLGVTFGPWEYRPAKGRNDPVGHGHFISVWKRDPGKPWRLALDLGVSHDQPKVGLGQVRLTEGPAHAQVRDRERRRSGVSVGAGVFSGGFGFGIGAGGVERDYDDRRTAHEVHTMMSAERSLAFAARTKGAARAYETQATEDLRFFREGAQPAVGIEAAISAAPPRGRETAWIPRGQGVARSWDVGYSYGLAVAGARASAHPDTAAYLHVWRKDTAGRWKLMLDVEKAYPKPAPPKPRSGS